MAVKYFTQLGLDNVVINTFNLDESYGTKEGVYSENTAKEYLANSFNTTPDRFAEYSPNGSFRIRSASIGGTYDFNNNVFINAKPYNSWTSTGAPNFDWEPPVAQPVSSEGSAMLWKEENSRWQQILPNGTSQYWDPNTSSWITFTI